jgi:hypothetical protein
MTRTKTLILTSAAMLITTTVIIVIRSWRNVSSAYWLEESLSKNYTLVAYPPCAPWIPPEQRVIAFEKMSWLPTWEYFHSSVSVYHGGEPYWAASLAYVLGELDFQVVRRDMDVSLLRDMQTNKIFKFIYNTNAPDSYPEEVVKHALFQDPNITCRWHFLDYFAGNLRYKQNGTTERESYNPFPSDPIELGYDPRHVLAVLPGHTNTPINYIIHSQITLPAITENKRKPRAAFLLSKHCEFDIPVVKALLDAGFTLHTTCYRSENQEQLKLDEEISKEQKSLLIHHPRMHPIDYSRLLREVAFLIGFGMPPESPSPYEALANGAAYLQIKCTCAAKCRVGAIQHRPLRNVGFPYVYDYIRDCNDTKTTKSVVAVAEQAYNNPFPAYIPSQHSLGTVLSQVCTNLIESTAMCDCARLQARIETDTEEKLQQIRNCRNGSFNEFELQPQY